MCRACEAFPVLDWLKEKGVRLRPAPAYVLRYLFENADGIRTVEDLCEQTRCAQSSVRFMLRKKSLPPAQVWVQVARLLDMRRRMGAEPEVSVEQLAFREGLCGHSALSHRFRYHFGVSARGAVLCSEADLMERWWERASARTERKLAAA